MIRLFHYASLAGLTANLTALLSLLARVFTEFKPAYFSLIGIGFFISAITIFVLITASQKGVNIPIPLFITSSVILISIILGGVLGWLR